MSCSNCNSENDSCGCKTSTDDIVYQGPTLECLGIENCDTITEVLIKINTLVCSDEFVQTIINNIANNATLLAQFTTIVNQSLNCTTVFNCLVSTTTTTTIAPPLMYCYSISSLEKVNVYWLDANGNPQFDTFTNDTIYVCAQLDSVVASELAEILGGDTLCTTELDCQPTTTTTTTVEPTTTTTTTI